MDVVEIREDVLLTPYCPLCKVTVGDGTTVRREAATAKAAHEITEHPDPDEEDA